MAQTSAPSMRPRAIDPQRELLVLKDVEDLKESGLNLGQRDAANVVTGMDREEEKEVHLRKVVQQQYAQGQDGKVPFSSIPTPEVNIKTDWEKTSRRDFFQPVKYVRYSEPHWNDADAPVEYDMDSDDERFLAGINKKTNKPVSPDAFETLMDYLEKATNSGTPVEIHDVKAPVPVTDKALRAIYDYWIVLRTQYNRPLLRVFWPTPEFNDPSPHVAFRPREKHSRRVRSMRRGNDQNSYLKLEKLRREFDRARDLLELIIRREKIKHQIMQNRMEIFKQMCAEDRYPDKWDLVWDLGADDVDRPAKRAKKKKRQRRDSDDSLDWSDSDDAMDPSNTLFLPAGLRADYGKSTAIVKLRHDWDAPYGDLQYNYMGAPMPSRFQGRARVGRGGRIVYDRVVGRPPSPPPHGHSRAYPHRGPAGYFHEDTPVAKAHELKETVIERRRRRANVEEDLDDIYSSFRCPPVSQASIDVLGDFQRVLEKWKIRPPPPGGGAVGGAAGGGGTIKGGAVPIPNGSAMPPVNYSFPAKRTSSAR